MSHSSRFILLGLMLVAACIGAGRAAVPAQVGDRIIQSIRLEVPMKGESKDSWDPSLSVLAGNLRNIYPDVRICVESPHVPGRCLVTCENANRPTDQSGHVCEVSTGPNGILLEPTLYVLADDIDDYGGNERIAMFKIISPEKCSPCTLELPGGTLQVSLVIKPVTTYGGPYRGVVGTFTPDLPVATTSNGAAPASRPRTLQEILDQLLPDLRDADNCTGADRGVFGGLPSGTMMFRGRLNQMLGSSAEADRIFQMAILASAFQNPAARVEVERFLRTKGIDTDSPMWALAVADLRYSNELDDALHEGVKYLVDKALDRAGAAALRGVLPALSRNELVQEIELKMAAKLATSGAKDFMEQMLKSPRMTAECAMNELAKMGLGDVIQNPPR